jgi:hypothetical protein
MLTRETLIKALAVLVLRMLCQTTNTALVSSTKVMYRLTQSNTENIHLRFFTDGAQEGLFACLADNGLGSIVLSNHIESRSGSCSRALQWSIFHVTDLLQLRGRTLFQVLRIAIALHLSFLALCGSNIIVRIFVHQKMAVSLSPVISDTYVTHLEFVLIEVAKHFRKKKKRNWLLQDKIFLVLLVHW